MHIDRAWHSVTKTRTRNIKLCDRCPYYWPSDMSYLIVIPAGSKEDFRDFETSMDAALLRYRLANQDIEGTRLSLTGNTQ